MPRPKPPFELEPKPSSVSFPRYVKGAGETLIKGRPALMLRDFSDLVNRALAEYIERHHPGLLDEVRSALAKGYPERAEDTHRIAAEDAEVRAIIAPPGRSTRQKTPRPKTSRR